MAYQPLKDFVVDWVKVLGFIDQGERKLRILSAKDSGHINLIVKVNCAFEGLLDRAE
ncbi:hypothetical protein D3C83_238660 [compost metagenome]